MFRVLSLGLFESTSNPSLDRRKRLCSSLSSAETMRCQHGKVPTCTTPALGRLSTIERFRGGENAASQLVERFRDGRNEASALVRLLRIAFSFAGSGLFSSSSSFSFSASPPSSSAFLRSSSACYCLDPGVFNVGPEVDGSPVRSDWQGLTLVHFSAQPEPFLTLNTSPKRQNTPSNPAFNTA